MTETDARQLVADTLAAGGRSTVVAEYDTTPNDIFASTDPGARLAEARALIDLLVNDPSGEARGHAMRWLANEKRISGHTEGDEG